MNIQSRHDHAGSMLADTTNLQRSATSREMRPREKGHSYRKMAASGCKATTIFGKKMLIRCDCTSGLFDI